MPASQATTHTRRSIQRFALQNVTIDDRPNVYKNPQLVLKPQLELAPRRPYTGSRPRMPVWRHFLMVHVKDKADELVKLDLATFKQPSVVLDPVLRNSVSCLPAEQSLIFQHPNATETGWSKLRIVLQKPADLETMFSELCSLGISVEHELTGQSQSPDSGEVGSGPGAEEKRPGPPAFLPFQHLRQPNDPNSPSPTAPNAYGRYAAFSEGFPHSAVARRPPSHPTGQPVSFQPGQRPWSPASVPSRPATTLGVPGVLGEGIYKISRVGSASSSRPRVRRTATILEYQGPRLYTVSKHFDKTLSRGDIVPASRGPYVGRRLSSSLRSDDTALGVARFSSPGHSTAETLQQSSQECQSTSQPPARMLSVLERVQDTPQYPGYPPFPNSPAHGQIESAVSQPTTTSRVAWPSDDASITSSSQTLLELPNRQEMEDDWLLRISQVQHEGLCEASLMWDDLMGRASVDMASVDGPEAVSEVLAKYEGEFARRWDAVLSATAQKMREARVGGFVS